MGGKNDAHGGIQIHWNSNLHIVIAKYNNDLLRLKIVSWGTQ